MERRVQCRHVRFENDEYGVPRVLSRRGFQKPRTAQRVVDWKGLPFSDFFELGKEKGAQIAVSTQDLMSLNLKYLPFLYAPSFQMYGVPNHRVSDCQRRTLPIFSPLQLLAELADSLRSFIALLCKAWVPSIASSQGNDALSLLDILSSFAVLVSQSSMPWSRPKFNSGNVLPFSLSLIL